MDDQFKIKKKNQESSTEILFQKLGNRWYAFAEGEQGPIFTALPEGLDPRSTEFEFFEILENEINYSIRGPKKPSSPSPSA
jgi:hypothetical protein